MDLNKKTHRDYQAIIGGTAASSRNYLEKRWNQYYFKTYRHVVSRMIGGPENCVGKTVLDVGTSHGNWYSFLKGQGFAELLGVELDPERAYRFLKFAAQGFEIAPGFPGITFIAAVIN